MIIVRETRKSDLNQIKENEIEFLLEQARYYKELLKINEEGKKSSRISIDNNFHNKNYKFFVAEISGKLIGHIFGKIAKRQKIYFPQKFGLIEVLYVKPAYRKRGIGKKLYSKMLEWFKSRRIICIELDASKSGNISKFWKNLGFTEILSKMEKRI